MATGTVGLLWYFLCCGFIVFTVLVAAGLFMYGKRAEKKRREQLPADPPDPSA